MHVGKKIHVTIIHNERPVRNTAISEMCNLLTSEDQGSDVRSPTKTKCTLLSSCKRIRRLVSAAGGQTTQQLGQSLLNEGRRFKSCFLVELKNLQMKLVSRVVD